MNVKLILIISFSYLYMFFEFWMSRRERKNRNIEKSNDKGSLWILVFSIFLGYFLSFSFGATKFGRIYHWNTFFAIGVVLVCVGLYIRISSILTLKQHFTYTVTKIDHHELIETGWYKTIRHPGYLGQLLIFLGIATSMSNWLSFIGMTLPVLAGFVYRISVEEKFMAKNMGEKYLEYRKRTWRMISGVF